MPSHENNRKSNHFKPYRFDGCFFYVLDGLTWKHDILPEGIHFW